MNVTSFLNFYACRIIEVYGFLIISFLLERIYIYLHISDACHPYEPFKCPGDGTCISIQYLCDGAPDCQDGYDEDSKLCTAGDNKFNFKLILNNLQENGVV